jgi:hypothetical protein
MKKHFFLGMLLIVCSFTVVNGQCIKPTPMTADQVQKVTGKWKGSYTHNGSQVDLEVNIAAKTGNEVDCIINNPPIKGKETAVEYFFCPGGEFHLRKYIGDVSFVFQGTPENNSIKGLVSMYDSKNKRTLLGHFTLGKAE